MPISVYELFRMAGRECNGRVSWGQPVNCNTPGVYVVALSPSVDKLVCADTAPISKSAIQEWIEYVPTFKLDHFRPTRDALIHRLQGFWLPDETILYIGKAGISLNKRVGQFYNHILGEPRPHRGGHWLKTLDNLAELSIYWTAFQDEPAHDVESRYIGFFVDNVSMAIKEKLIDPFHPFPFANLEFPHRTRKNHGLSKQVNH